jgi:hypothetical protein
MGGIFNFVARALFFSFAAAARTGGALLALEAGAEAGEAAETLLRADFRADSEFFAFIAQNVRRTCKTLQQAQYEGARFQVQIEKRSKIAKTPSLK